MIQQNLQMEDASPSKASSVAGDNSSISSDAESWIVLDQDDVTKEEQVRNMLSESEGLLNDSSSQLIARYTITHLYPIVILCLARVRIL